MAQSRKDSRGYALRSGECQRKDGRYSYSYTDKNRNRHTIYATDLISLRKREQQIRRDLEDGLDPRRAERITVNQVYDAYIKQKYDLKGTTRANYIYTYDHYIRETFGKRRLCEVKYTDVKKFYYDLLTEEGLSPATVDNVHTQLHPAFGMAVRDGYIRVNPAAGVLGEIKKSHVWVQEKRKSLTVPQQKAFMNYLYENHRYEGWKPVITVLIGSGMRIGECLGLRWQDLDFENRTISVNHNLVHRKLEKGGESLHINTPKTAAGMRTIPMIEQVYEAFMEEYQIQQITGFCTQEIEGYSGFVFSSSNCTVTLPVEVNRAIHLVIAEYNKEETAKAKKEKREAFLLPDISAHHLRHTFCTRLCENETNLKVIQSIMSFKNYIKNHAYADIGWMMHTVRGPKGYMPMDFNRMISCGTEFEIVATGAYTGKPIYLKPTQMQPDNCWCVIASATLPVASRPYIHEDSAYYDGGLSNPIPIKRCFEEKGCDKVVLILTRPKDYQRKPDKDRRMAALIRSHYPGGARALSKRAEKYNRELEQAKKLEESGKVLILAPEDIGKMSAVSKDREMIKKLYENGLKEAEKLDAFLGL